MVTRVPPERPLRGEGRRHPRRADRPELGVSRRAARRRDRQSRGDSSHKRGGNLSVRIRDDQL